MPERTPRCPYIVKRGETQDFNLIKFSQEEIAPEGNCLAAEDKNNWSCQYSHNPAACHIFNHNDLCQTVLFSGKQIPTA